MRDTKHIDGIEWTKLCKSIDVTARQGTRVEVDIEHDIALFRIDGKVYGVTNVCPHKREASIAKGHVDNGIVTCPMHCWSFEVKSGKNVDNGSRLTIYEVIELMGYVWANLDSR